MIFIGKGFCGAVFYVDDKDENFKEITDTPGIILMIIIASKEAGCLLHVCQMQYPAMES